jgi:quinoprotein glucose dehydrogenase
VPSLPIFKPPYGEIIAMDLNRGEILWRAPVGDSPSIRNHPSLKGVTLPERLGVAGAPGAIVTAGGLVLVGGADTALNAFDTRNGELLARIELSRRTSGTPMTYRTRSGQQIVVVSTGAGRDAALVALAVR